MFRNSYISSKIIEWNELDQDIRNVESYALFRKHLLSFIRTEQNSIFNVHNAKQKKLDYELVLIILRNSNFCHNFQDAINPLCGCGNFVKLTTPFLIHCIHFFNE